MNNTEQWWHSLRIRPHHCCCCCCYCCCWWWCIVLHGPPSARVLSPTTMVFFVSNCTCSTNVSKLCHCRWSANGSRSPTRRVVVCTQTNDGRVGTWKEEKKIPFLIIVLVENQSHIEKKKSVSIDPARHCIYTSKNKIKLQVRIHSTPQVLRALYNSINPPRYEYHQHVPYIRTRKTATTHQKRRRYWVNATLDWKYPVRTQHCERCRTCNQIETSVSIDPTRPCIYTSTKHKKNTCSYTFNTFNVQSDPSLHVHMFILWSVLEVTQRVYNQHVS